MKVPEIFKYSSLVSVPLFTGVVLLLIKKAPGFSSGKHTVSKSVNFMTRRVHAFVFRANFIVKALLDLGFVLYLLYRFHIPLTSWVSVSLIMYTLLFGSLAYFLERTHTFLHRFIVYLSGALWAVGQIYIVMLIGDKNFLLFSYIAISVPFFLGLGLQFADKVNLRVQAFCLSVWYLWLIVFVFRFL